MSNPKRSRASGNVIPLDAGKKDRTTPMPLTAPAPPPMIACLKVKVVIGKDGEGKDLPPRWVEVANYPSEGGLEAFYDLIHRAPDDSFLTADAAGSIPFASIVAIRRPKDSCEEFPVKVGASPNGSPKLHYRRLRVKFGRNRDEIVDIANVPWSENGIAHFALLIGKHRRCDFLTSDYGFLNVAGVDLEDLTMPGDPPTAARAKFRPEDILRLEDLPE
ncbi:MAG: hypothetical protein AAB554_02220 [Patescibacteria group bacterium]